ncbi:DUF4230 domain-containing protein [Cytophagaceae bacterium ABcell3]|nr:DUF4230 domain-containing protein [Cytophagaceae bacterium ABcell3]
MRILLHLFPWGIVILMGVYIYGSGQKHQNDKEEREVVSHDVLVEKISSLGKLELIKYNLKDIVEHKVIKQWLPDPKVVLIASGEIVGCVNLAMVDSSSIRIMPDAIYVQLPEPEICYLKLDHQRSRVYHMEYHYFEQAKLIDKAYRQAEKQMAKSAQELDVVGQTKAHAKVMLKSFLENFTDKKVYLNFESDEL